MAVGSKECANAAKARPFCHDVLKKISKLETNNIGEVQKAIFFSKCNIREVFNVYSTISTGVSLTKQQNSRFTIHYSTKV